MPQPWMVPITWPEGYAQPCRRARGAPQRVSRAARLWAGPGPPSLQADACALFDGEGVVGGLQLDEGALADRLGMDARLQVECRRRVHRKIGGEPAEVGPFGLPTGPVPPVRSPGGALAAERDPDTPGEHLVTADERYLDQALDAK